MKFDKDFFLEYLQKSLIDSESSKPQNLSDDVLAQQDRNNWKTEIKATKLAIEKLQNYDLAKLKKDPFKSDWLWRVGGAVADEIFRRNPNEKRTDDAIVNEVVSLFFGK